MNKMKERPFLIAPSDKTMLINTIISINILLQPSEGSQPPRTFRASGKMPCATDVPRFSKTAFCGTSVTATDTEVNDPQPLEITDIQV